MRKRVLTSLCLLLSLAPLAVPSRAQQIARIWTGLPIYFGTLTLHVSGQPISVYLFVVSVYPMNTPPPWPIGLWLYNYVQADSGDPQDKSTWGHSSWCRWWFYQVVALEQQNPKHVPYPFFELNLQTDVGLIHTDERIPVYPAGSVTCWQADNDYAP